MKIQKISSSFKANVSISILLWATLYSAASMATPAAKMVRYQLWFEGVSAKSKSTVLSQASIKPVTNKVFESNVQVEELSRPMHLVLKKHKILINQ